MKLKKKNEIILGCAAATLSMLFLKSKKRKKLDPYLAERPRKGRFVKDFNDLQQSTQNKFHENYHVDHTSFTLLHQLVEPYLIPICSTHTENGISTKEKLAAVLEYFACGSLQRHVAAIYIISKQHFGIIIDQVCHAITMALKEHIPTLTKGGFLEIATDFNDKWQFSNCIGAIDGKHAHIKCPNKSGSLFYNHKGFHSIILMAVADAWYRFTFIDVGAYGSENDPAVFSKSKLGAGMETETIEFPNDASIGNQKLPFFFLGDDAFPLHKRIMKPYVPKKKGTPLSDEERIYNYRLSRARRCVENAFGVLCSRFYCLSRIMHCQPKRASKIIIVCCYLHNFLTNTIKQSYSPSHYIDHFNINGNLVEGEWRKRLTEKSLYNSNFRYAQGRHTTESKNMREYLKFFVSSVEGSVSWQRIACNLE